MRREMALLHRRSTLRRAMPQRNARGRLTSLAVLRAMGHHGRMNCRLAHEALSARIDGEREPASAKSVDVHLASCSDCRLWYARARADAQRLDDLAAMSGLRRRSRLSVVEQTARKRPQRPGRLVVLWARWSLALVGVLVLALTVAQMTAAPGGSTDDTGIHLLGESAAWSLAIGAAMILAAVLPTAAAGLVGVLTTYTGVLAVYVVADAARGVVSPLRELGHLPVLMGAILALLVWQGTRAPQPAPIGAATVEPNRTDIQDPHAVRTGSGSSRRSPRGGSAA